MVSHHAIRYSPGNPRGAPASAIVDGGRRDVIARYGLTVRDVHDVVEAAVRGMSISTVIAGRSRFSANVRYAPDYRADPEALRSILVQVGAGAPAARLDPGASGAGAAPMGAPACRA